MKRRNYFQIRNYSCSLHRPRSSRPRHRLGGPINISHANGATPFANLPRRVDQCRCFPPLVILCQRWSPPPPLPQRRGSLWEPPPARYSSFPQAARLPPRVALCRHLPKRVVIMCDRQLRPVLHSIESAAGATISSVSNPHQPRASGAALQRALVATRAATGRRSRAY